MQPSASRLRAQILPRPPGNIRCSLLSLLTFACLSLLTACAVGPDYVRQTVTTPAAFKELDGWKLAQPQDTTVRTNWWELYGDPLLNGLVEQVSISNQTLAQASASFRQARALVDAGRAGYYPTLGANLSTTRASARSRTSQVLTTDTSSSQSGASTSHTLTIDASWEIDLWGRVQRTVEAERAAAQASAADLASVRLSVQAQLVQNYFSLRGLDTQQQLLERTLADYQRSVVLNQNQYDAGIAPRSNLILAQSQYKTTQAQAIDVGVQRAQLEHAIALLTGQAPANFSLSHAQLTTVVPLIPLVLPSDLLERRPDIAAAERRMQAANAQIGVAKSAYFPQLSLAASGGTQSSVFADLFSLPNRFWSLGPALATTFFDGGLRQSQVAQATAAYDGTVAAYRQVVLTGFQEVEDNLAALRILEQEAQVQDEAAALARRSVELTVNQYKAGIVTYLNVIQVQTAALSNEQAALSVLNRRLNASVLLVKALGGGWNAATLPATLSLRQD